MKKILLLIVLCAFVSCGSPQKKAEKLIMAYLKENLNDPKSYESVKFERLDTLFTTLQDNSNYATASDSVFSAKRKLDMAQIKLNVYTGNYDFEIKEREEATNIINYWSGVIERNQLIIDGLELAFVPEIHSYYMEHKYRANNAMGAKILISQTFYIDKEITKIEDTEPEL